jgi:uncharacterized membrane protein YbhN (UPF0104 family)
MVGEGDVSRAHRAPGLGKITVVIGKLAITGACFWYLSRQIDFASVAQAFTTIHVGWAFLAAAAIATQIPLVGIRWSKITDALAETSAPVSRRSMVAITAIGIFFGQVLPYAAGDAMRVWLLARLGRAWRLGIVSVLIDRAIGVATLLAVGFVVLLLPSALTALNTRWNLVLATFGGVVAATAFGLILAPRLAPLMMGWRYTRWAGSLALASHQVLITSRSGASITLLAVMIHILTIASVWCTGQALGMPVSVVDAAVLFVLMLGVSLIPISFGGWGVRELAVVSLLASHGVPEHRALFFSVSFGLVLLAGALPGALVWALYSPAEPEAAETGHAG